MYPQKFTKEEFIDFLKNQEYDEKIINKVIDLPDKINYEEDDYVFNFIGNKDKPNAFELNYFSSNKFDFLFPYVVYENLETGIDLVAIRLKKMNIV